MAARPYTPERAYRVSVRPLAGFMILGGLVGVAFAVLLPQPPHVRLAMTAGGKRILMAVTSVPSLLIGVGLWRRLKVAWYALFGYLIIGTILVGVSMWLDIRPERVSDWILLAVPMLLYLSVIVGLYFVTRPVFRGSHHAKEHQ